MVADVQLAHRRPAVAFDEEGMLRSHAERLAPPLRCRSWRLRSVETRVILNIVIMLLSTIHPNPRSRIRKLDCRNADTALDHNLARDILPLLQRNRYKNPQKRHNSYILAHNEYDYRSIHLRYK